MLTLEGKLNGKDLMIRLRCSEQDDHLATRGFRGINEFPFYR